MGGGGGCVGFGFWWFGVVEEFLEWGVEEEELEEIVWEV